MLTGQDFEELDHRYAHGIPGEEVKDIPWGRMSDAQFDTLVKRVASFLQQLANSSRKNQRESGLFPTRQNDGKWLRAIEWPSMIQVMDDVFGVDVEEIQPPFGPEVWFLYFWRIDAKKRSSPAEQKKFLLAAQHFFVYDKLLKKPKLKPELRGRLRNIGNDVLVRDLLEATLECAFTRIAMPSVDRYDVQLQVVRDFSQRLTAHGLMGDNRKIGWRCEARTYDKVLKAGGLTRQVDSEARRRALHFDQSWHPFSLQRNTNCFWYRRGNRDNDNYLVVSVAHAFSEAICFPKLADAKFLGLPADPTDWPSAVQADNKDSLFDVHFADGGPARRMVGQEVNVFLLLIDGDFFDTAGYQAYVDQAAFPEWGASRIDRSNIWGAIPVTKIYHGLKDEDGFTAIIDVKQAKEQINYYNGWHIVRPGWEARFRREFETVLSEPVFGRRWTGNGGEDIPPTIDGRVVDPEKTKKVGHVALLKQAFEKAGKNLGGGYTRVDIGRSSSPAVLPKPNTRPRGSTL